MFEKIKLHKNKRGFTLIELIVVMAVIAVLVLLAAPRFIGRTDEAKKTQIINDVSVAEDKVLEWLATEDDVTTDWNYDDRIGNGERTYSRSGEVVQAMGGPLELITDDIVPEINSNLDGDFYANEKGEVFYQASDGKATDSNVYDYDNLEEYLLMTYGDVERVGRIFTRKGILDSNRRPNDYVTYKIESRVFSSPSYFNIDEDDEYEIKNNTFGLHSNSYFFGVPYKELGYSYDEAIQFEKYYDGSVVSMLPNAVYTNDVEKQIKYHHETGMIYDAYSKIDGLQTIIQQQYDYYYENGLIALPYQISIGYITLNDGKYLRVAVETE